MIRSLLCLLIATTVSRAAVSYVPANVAAPEVPREFRGAWVATVRNIDWPSKPGLSTANQKAELLAILNRSEQLKLNVVVFQVRPACDAFYASKLEPWSEFLTGTMGKAPNPFWDPLEFAVTEAHKRGLELHAWANPFRARFNTSLPGVSGNHISKTRPPLAKSYGQSMWLDPGLAEVHDHSMRVLLDIVKRYDIDGLHIDDYFYPYREKDAAGKLIPFPDWTSWNAYVKSGGKLARDDWRRDNVNRFVARMYREVKAAKPWIKVGISPFGIYRPGFPAQIKGFDQFESIYADPRLWLANGWVDYLAPQLYWRIDPPVQSFPVLLKWWTENNPKGRMIVPGINTTSTGPAKGWPASEIVEQVRIARQQPGSSGHIHWNMSALMNNRGGVADELARAAYGKNALPSGLPTGSTTPKPTLSGSVSYGSARFTWSVTNDAAVRFWLAQTKDGKNWHTDVLPRGTIALAKKNPPEVFVLRAVDRFGNFGAASAIELRREPK
ncbi:MAG TPA: family 10 glycosylhydrolase [Candidatus Acidoferrum sp.]|nr:family 10 glycosylhydrolase [Candidatus Acidoferrum sp.]